MLHIIGVWLWRCAISMINVMFKFLARLLKKLYFIIKKIATSIVRGLVFILKFIVDFINYTFKGVLVFVKWIVIIFYNGIKFIFFNTYKGILAFFATLFQINTNEKSDKNIIKHRKRAEKLIKKLKKEIRRKENIFQVTEVNKVKNTIEEKVRSLEASVNETKKDNDQKNKIDPNVLKILKKRKKDLERAKKEELRRKKEEERKKKKRLLLEEKEQRKQYLEEKREKRKRKLIRKKLNKEKKLLEAKSKKEKIIKEKLEAKEEKKQSGKLIKEGLKQNKIKSNKEKKSLKEIFNNWYNNLTFVKDRKNRLEMKRQTLLIDFEGEDAVRSEQKVVYKYVAKNLETGKIEKGMFSAFSKLDVHSYLLSENYEVYEIVPQPKLNSKIGGGIVTGKFKKSDLVFFLTQLSTFLKAGITLIESVKILSKQTKKPIHKHLYKAVIYELTMGENFSDALEKQGEAFPKLLVNMIKTSELTGNLPETLDDMAEYYTETEKTRKQMISAMMYPIVVSLFAIVIIVFILLFVIPEFVSIYDDLETDLPVITQTVINISDFLQKNIIYILIGTTTFFIVFHILFKTIKVFKSIVQWTMMHMPIMGKIVIYNEVTMFTKTFASLLNHNVFITDSMEVLSKITNNEIYKMLIFDTITNLAKGETISNSFKNHWAFPVVAYEMLLTGERTGQLGDMMNKVAVYYQEMHRNAVNQIKTFIEPIMIVFLSVVVGTILLSVILPMFTMYSSVT